MEINKETVEVMKAWGEISQKILRRKLFQLGAVDTKKLMFSTQVSDPINNQIKLQYDYYGMFVDMGVGNGASLSNQKQTRRRPKKWYSPTIWREVAKLSELLMSEHAINLQAGILYETKLPKGITLNP